MLQQYTGRNILYVFVALSFILFLYEKDKRERCTALIVIVLLSIVLFNPWSYDFLIKVTSQNATYYRFLWLFPCEVSFAFFIYKGLQHIKNLKHQMVFVCGICIGVLCLCTRLDEWNLPENPYQIPSEIIEVSEALKTLRVENSQKQSVIIGDAAIYYTLRQYDANTCFPFPRFDVTEWNGGNVGPEVIMFILMNNRNDIDPHDTQNVLEANKIDYLVIHINNTISLEYLQQLGWQVVATTSAYHILEYEPSNGN